MAHDQQRVNPPARRADEELEQGITAAEDARDEAARLAQELDRAWALLAERDRELESFRADAQRRDAMVKSLMREVEDRARDGYSKDVVMAEELQVTVEELHVSLEELQHANEELEHANEELERRVAERTAGLRESEERFRRALEIETVGVIFFNTDGAITEANDAFLGMCGFSREDVTANLVRWDRLTPPEWMAASERAIGELRVTGRTTPYEKEYLRKDGSRWWGLFAARRIGENESVEFVLDVTDRKAGEDRQKLLLAELDHRVKNTLAMVQSIAAQTLRSSGTPERFAEAFQTRLQALAQAHDLLTRARWEAVSLRELADLTLGPHGTKRVRTGGPEVVLEPGVAISLHLALHELATNAAKYGALSVSGGCVKVNWAVEDKPKPTLRIEWRESEGPPVSQPTRRGFGSRLIERGLAHEFDGEVDLDFDQAGVRCRIDIPLSSRVRMQ
jgi:PAS domain S-box-containing protein